MLDFQVLTKAVADLNEIKVLDMLDEFVSSSPSGEDVTLVINSCQQGMSQVGDLFSSNVYFIGDLVFAGELLTAIVNKLRPVMGESNNNETGNIVLATVEGDIHDIGKNIFKSMAEGAGFRVYDLGIDTSADAIVEKIEEMKPEILGMSGVLTLSLNSMKKVVDALNEKGLRDGVKVIIGGNPVSEGSCKEMGADAFTRNASEGVKICQEWMK